jgi:hypothetical protein
MTPEEEFNTQRYFDYFRRRRAAIDHLDAVSMDKSELSPDQSILLSAGLAAMASEWSDKFKPIKQDGEQFDEFLRAANVHPCFERVCLPFF